MILIKTILGRTRAFVMYNCSHYSHEHYIILQLMDLFSVNEIQVFEPAAKLKTNRNYSSHNKWIINTNTKKRMPLDIFVANILNLFTQLNLMDKSYINRRLIVFCKDLKSAKVQQFN